MSLPDFYWRCEQLTALTIDTTTLKRPTDGVVTKNLVIQAPQQWVISPLGFNILLSALKDGRPSVEKYIQRANHVKEKNICSINTKLFLSASCKLKDEVKKSIKVSDAEETDFSKHDNAFSAWVNRNKAIRNDDISREINSKTDYILANVTSFESTWDTSRQSGPLMKIYNSFSYTQDVKYEARLLELPLQSGLKMIVIIPNEVDVLQTLFRTLKKQGLDAAVRSIQPLFTVNCELNAPNITVTSRIEDSENLNGFVKSSIVQYGSLIVNKNGTRIIVLTYICSPSNTIAVNEQHQRVDKPFYMAVVYEDMSLFIGQFTK